MNRRGVTMITAALLLTSSGAYYAYSNGGQSKLPVKQTPVKKVAPSMIRLEIVIDGGFAYIPSGTNTLNVAYLNDFKYTGANDADPATPASTVFCDVKQMGTELEVTGGTVVVPGPTQTKFDVTGASISFPVLNASTATLSANRPARPSSPFKPANPANAAEWADLRFIASLRAEHGAKLNPKWRFLVNGVMVLKGGTLKGQKPVRFAGHTFDFRRGPESQFVQSMTDRTLYTVDVVAEQIEIELDSDSGDQKIVVKPTPGPTRMVRLSLTGLHDKNAVLAEGGELKEHCTFYQLFDPVPQPTSWLRPRVMAQDAATRVLIPHSPGFFCPGEWF
jgi:hypothetical protein